MKERVYVEKSQDVGVIIKSLQILAMEGKMDVTIGEEAK
jgi:predicted nuclease with TOPRIM domain